jgi:hypothetical protein
VDAKITRFGSVKWHSPEEIEFLNWSVKGDASECFSHEEVLMKLIIKHLQTALDEHRNDSALNMMKTTHNDVAF